VTLLLLLVSQVTPLLLKQQLLILQGAGSQVVLQAV
jgi:hypothetical protein